MGLLNFDEVQKLLADYQKGWMTREELHAWLYGPTIILDPEYSIIDPLAIDAPRQPK